MALINFEQWWVWKKTFVALNYQKIRRVLAFRSTALALTVASKIPSIIAVFVLTETYRLCSLFH